MMSFYKNNRMLAWIVFFALGLGQVASADPNPVPRLQKVLWVWLENTSYSQMINQKYTKSLFKKYPSARFSSYLAVSPVTQANAVAMISGTDFGIQDNDLTKILNPTIVDLLESKNIPWRVYAEEYPGSCYLNAGGAEYQRYRVPFLSVGRVQSDRYLCMKVVGFRNLQDDVQYGGLPDFAVVIPSLNGSGATSNAATADATLRKVLDPLVTNDAIMQETTVIVTTVNQADPKNPSLFTFILGNGVASGIYTISTPYNHYNLLRTIEDGMGLGNLNQNDAKADPMVGFWKN